jgi:hypothetical protein
MELSEIILKDMSNLFRYEKLSREIDEINDIDELKLLCKYQSKLYIKQQEVLTDLKWPNIQ